MHGCRITIPVPKMDTISVAIANFLPQIDAIDQRRWRALKEAVAQANAKNLETGVSDTSVRIGISDVEAATVAMDVDPVAIEDDRNDDGDGGEDDDGEGGEEDDGDDGAKDDEENQADEDLVVSPVRRSTRQPKVSSRVLLAGEAEAGVDNDGEEEVPSTSGKGKEIAVPPQEKKKPMYLAFDASRHFYWEQAVRSVVRVFTRLNSWFVVRILFGR